MDNQPDQVEDRLTESGIPLLTADQAEGTVDQAEGTTGLCGRSRPPRGQGIMAQPKWIRKPSPFISPASTHPAPHGYPPPHGLVPRPAGSGSR